MASSPVEKAREPQSGLRLLAAVADQGSAAHPYPAGAALLSHPASPRNIADALHFLCLLHGRCPGLIELAAAGPAEPCTAPWLSEAGAAFAMERAYLTRLAIAAGPVPGTPGGAISEAAVLGQREALATLARSERVGCAAGAALALAADWRSVRAMLDRAAERLGVEPPPFGLGDPFTLRSVADGLGRTPSRERAMLFAAEQVALQHSGLWSLLEARQQARGAC